MLEIGCGGNDQAGEKYRVDEGESSGLMSEKKPATEKGDGGQKFDEEIADRNRRATIGTFTSEINPRNQGNVQIEGDGVFAMRTVRRRRNDALLKRQSMDANIEKTSDDRP